MDISNRIDKSGECWFLLTRGKVKRGWRPQVTEMIDGRLRYRYAYRVTYEHFVGPIPEGMTIDHLCKQTDCINPFHLEVVTRAENGRRGRVDANAKATLVKPEIGKQAPPPPKRRARS